MREEQEVLSPPQRLLQWGNGKKTGKEKESGERGSVHCALLFPFSPAPMCFISPLPIPQPTGKTMKETSSGGESRGWEPRSGEDRKWGYPKWWEPDQMGKIFANIVQYMY